VGWRGGVWGGGGGWGVGGGGVGGGGCLVVGEYVLLVERPEPALAELRAQLDRDAVPHLLARAGRASGRTRRAARWDRAVESAHPVRKIREAELCRLFRAQEVARARYHLQYLECQRVPAALEAQTHPLREMRSAQTSVQSPFTDLSASPSGTPAPVACPIQRLQPEIRATQTCGLFREAEQ